MLVRHNISIYSDDMERAMGRILTKLHERESMGLVESGYWLGALAALQYIAKLDPPRDDEEYVIALAHRLALEDGYGDGDE